jgi:hypothetical protein
MSRRTFQALAMAAAAALAGSTAACKAKGIDALPPPPTTLAVPPTTAIPDYSGIGLKPVPGRTTTTVSMGPGRAVLRGVVNGPDGPVPGATVRAERLVGEGAASATVVTAADGTWAIVNVLGGRYRVRAWRPLDLALTKPDVFFLNDGDTREMALVLARYSGLAVTTAIAPNPPFIGQAANLVVQVVQQSVDPDGIVRGQPVINVSAELFGGGDWAVLTANPAVTDVHGRAEWQLRCRSSGKQALSVVVAGQQSFPLDLPACEQPPPETTTTSSSSTSSTSSTTSTTQP